MRRMRDVVRRNDIYWWLERFLRDLRSPRTRKGARAATAERKVVGVDQRAESPQRIR